MAAFVRRLGHVPPSQGAFCKVLLIDKLQFQPVKVDKRPCDAGNPAVDGWHRRVKVRCEAQKEARKRGSERTSQPASISCEGGFSLLPRSPAEFSLEKKKTVNRETRSASATVQARRREKASSMSFNRKNWSALSSLAQQWSVEDGEEQERERRRRHRQLSSTSETKEEEPSSTVQNVTRKTSNRVYNSLEEKLLNLENSALKNEKAEPVSVNKLEGRRVRRRAEFLNNIKQEKKILVSTKKFEKEPPEENPTSPPESSKEEGRIEKCETPIQQKDVIEESHPIQSQQKEEITLEQHEALKPEKDLKTDEDQIFREEEKVPNICESQRLAVTQNEVASQEPQPASWERKSISRLEVKIQPRARKFTDPAVATPASEAPQVTEKAIPKSNAKTIRSPSGQEGVDAAILISEPRITYSSSFSRISPRTISFRVVPRKERQEDALSRSASMRLPASTAKLEEKLERYTSAVQRAGSIKVSSPIRRNFQPASEGVASKRSIFEATIPVQNEPPTLVRKESLRIPGRVSSRINLWISRTQESKKNEGDKDVQRTGNTIQES